MVSCAPRACAPLRRRIAWALGAAPALLAALPAFGIGDEYKKEDAWTSRKPHNESQVGGCYMNLGPTGIRARLHELSFEVKYVFPKSPADGLI